MTADPKLEVALSSIQPIRDLARNWDVDIASCLEDYLQEIASVEQEEQAPSSHSAVHDATNFAQAALLLHNSSNVYSRKVEYLYTLVYAALDNLHLNSQNASNNKQATSKKVDSEIEDFDQFDQHVQFLLLEDVIPTQTDEDKINLPSCGGLQHHLDASAFLPSTTRLSLGMSATVDRSAAGATTQNNAVLGSLTSLGILQQTEGNSQGMFYMRGTAETQETNNRPSSFGADMNLSRDVPMLEDDGGFYNHDDCDDNDDDNDGPGFEIADPLDQSGPAPQPPAPQQQPKKQNDAWDLLDPHDAEHQKGRPLRIGTTFALPEGLSQPPSECVTGARTKKHAKQRKHQQVIADDPQPICIATATFKATMANEQRRRDRLSISGTDDDHDITIEKVERPVVPLQGLAFGDEFAYIAKAAARRKAAERREKRKLLQKEPQAIPQIEADQLLGYDDNDYGGDNDDADSYGDDNGGNAGFQVFDEAFSTSEHDTSNPDAVAFEELCRAHIRAFAKGAENYRAETNLTKRVGDWQSKLAPILEEEAARPEFDIHVYGEHVINTIKKNTDHGGAVKGDKTNHRTHFSSVTQAKKHYDVCRLFLASLSLVNGGNVKFNADEGRVMAPDTLVIELLNSSVDRPMETYLAPSALEGRSKIII